MRNYRNWIVILVISTCIAAHAAILELYGNYHAMGVIITLETGDDPDGNAVAIPAYRKVGSGDPYQPGYPLNRVASNRFVGSLFLLDPGSDYEVEVAFDDPGGVLHGQILALIGSTRAERTVPGPVQSWYASPDGSGDCGPGNPCSLATALNQANVGDHIVLYSGIYHTGEMSFPRSGTADQPIVIESALDDQAVIDGAYPGDVTWTPVPGGIYSTVAPFADTHLIVADGERLYPYGSYADMEALVWGLPGFYADGNTIYLHLSGGVDPAGFEILISRYNYAFLLDGRSGIVIRNLTFRHFGCGSYAKSIYLNNADDNLIQGCTFRINDLSIGIKRNSNRNLIENNRFSDTIFDWPWDAVKEGSELETGGIRFYDPATGRGNVIRHNTFNDFFDGFGVCPEDIAGLTNETDVYGNTGYLLGDDGMETDGQCSNVRIWDNTFHDVLIGISLAPVKAGPVYAVRNLVYRTGSGNNSYPGSPFKLNSSDGNSGSIYLFHNTSDGAESDTHGLDIKSPGNWTRLVTRNNIWRGAGYGLRDYNTSWPTDLDYDDIVTTGTVLVRWDSTNYMTLPAFTLGTGQEVHGWNIEPEFADSAAGDYRLQPDSALEDQGVLIPGINHDYSGAGPDPGAFEIAICHTGDGNGDGIITAGDAQLAFQIALLLIVPDSYQKCASDCNGDDIVTSGDAQTIFLAALGMTACQDPL